MNHKLRITPDTLEAYKAAKRRELERQGRPVPSVLLPSEPIQINMAEQNRQPRTEDINRVDQGKDLGRREST